MSRSEPLPQPCSSTTSQQDNEPLLLSSSTSSLVSDDAHDYHLFPSQPFDLVLHYRSASFFVHRSVLQRHSAYFRAYCEALQPSHVNPSSTVRTSERKKRKQEQAKDDVKEETAVPNKKRKTKSTTTPTPTRSSDPSSSFSAPSNKSSSTCSHPSTIPCIHLPDRCGIDGASVEVFLSFIRHLYFPRHYRCPPLLPDSEEDEQLEALDDIKLTITRAFPSSLPSPRSIDRYALRHGVEYHSGLMSLFHYFDCQQALQRCEQVIIADVARRFRHNPRGDDDEDWLWAWSEDEKEEEQEQKEDKKEETGKVGEVKEELKEWDEEEAETNGVFDEDGKVNVMEDFGPLLIYDCTRAWEWVRETIRFGLKKAEEAWVEVMGADWSVGRGEGKDVDYEGLLKELPMRVVVQVIKRMSRNMNDVDSNFHEYACW